MDGAMFINFEHKIVPLVEMALWLHDRPSAALNRQVLNSVSKLGSCMLITSHFHWHWKLQLSRIARLTMSISVASSIAGAVYHFD
jgi:hypothetical protein